MSDVVFENYGYYAGISYCKFHTKYRFGMTFSLCEANIKSMLWYISTFIDDVTGLL